MIEIHRIEVMCIGFADLLDISVFIVRILDEDIFLTQEIYFLEMVQIVDPMKESCAIESSK
jgi:hypothetical protein